MRQLTACAILGESTMVPASHDGVDSRSGALVLAESAALLVAGSTVRRAALLAADLVAERPRSSLCSPNAISAAQ